MEILSRFRYYYRHSYLGDRLKARYEGWQRNRIDRSTTKRFNRARLEIQDALQQRDQANLPPILPDRSRDKPVDSRYRRDY